MELQAGFTGTLDVSLEAIKVVAGFYTPDTVEEAFPGIDGTGVNIVIMDSGVDNTVHNTFAATPLVGFYDAMTGTFVDPDDDLGHGTHVASIALGQGAGLTTPRGVAPGAGLIDVRIFDASTTCATPGQWLRTVDGLETIYDKRNDWGVDIINMSFRQCNIHGATVQSDGKDTFSQLIDMAEVMGIVVVAGAGNDGTNSKMSTPAAATRAITVAASATQRTPNRNDDDVLFFSTRGKRQDDGDHDVIDELKPEVMAPGTGTWSGPIVGIWGALFDTATDAIDMHGTSMAAAHVAGLAALIIQQRPSINAASVKDLIISTAERRPVQWPPSAPGEDPEWNDGAGWGLIDAYEALNVGGATDLSYPGYPPSPSWMSPDISVNPSPVVGQISTVTVRVENKGSVEASNVRIHFGVYDYTVSMPLFSGIGTQIVDLPVGPTDVLMDWTPGAPGHLCLETEIAYGPDTDYSNNKAQQNQQVASSPVEFRVQNTLTEEPALIEFVPTFEFENLLGHCHYSGEPCVYDPIARSRGLL